MQTFAYTGVFRHRKLYDELRAAVAGELSLSAAQVFPGESVATVSVGVADNVQESTVAAVVAAHDPTTPGPAEATEIQHASNEATLRTRVLDAINTLEQAHANWPTLSAAQKDAALRLNVRVTAALARIQFRQLDSAP